MGHIFISYSHKDSSYVHKLEETLKNEGFEVWIDDRIDYGSEWPKVVTRNLDVSDAVIVVLSNNSYESDMVQNEVTRAREKKKPIFPLLLEGENWLIVQAKQFVDVRDGSLPAEKFYKRLEEITTRRTEKAEREVAEKARREKAKPKVAEEKPARKPYQAESKKNGSQRLQSRSGASPIYWIAGVIAITAASIAIASQFINPPPSPTATATIAKTLTPALTALARASQTPSIPHTPKVNSTNTPNRSNEEKLPPTVNDGMELVYVPEKQVFSKVADKSVTVPEFWIDRTPVTNAQFGEFVKLTGYRTEPEINKVGFSCMNAKCNPISGDNWVLHAETASNPVVQVSWNDARSYCIWAGRELMPDAELRAALDLGDIKWTSAYPDVDGEWLADKTSNLHRAVIGGWGIFSTNSNKMDLPENRSSSNLTFRCVAR